MLDLVGSRSVDELDADLESSPKLDSTELARLRSSGWHGCLEFSFAEDAFVHRGVFRTIRRYLGNRPHYSHRDEQIVSVTMAVEDDSPDQRHRLADIATGLAQLLNNAELICTEMEHQERAFPQASPRPNLRVVGGNTE